MRASADPILLQLNAGAPAWQGPAGPVRVIVDRELPGFTAVPGERLDLPSDTPRRATRSAEGFLCGALRRFALNDHGDHHELIAESWRVAWSNDGRRIWLPQPASASAALELGLGIGLVAALAARGVFCLHASALRWRDGVLAVVGASGSGKSSFARAVAAGDLAARVADDILPVDADAQAWPAFPQLKLDPDQWWPIHGGGLPLRAVAVLARGSETLEQLTTSRALTALLAATAGARAFPEDVLAVHLATAACWACDVPVFRLGVADRADDAAQAACEAMRRLERLA